mmetsp:Transcript_51107/g.109472  ORF Transcript_51107/g.109472 Transcript_51107/m.109472 type:complete len:154 (+) Transcript_51107:59-520(+)
MALRSLVLLACLPSCLALTSQVTGRELNAMISHETEDCDKSNWPAYDDIYGKCFSGSVTVKVGPFQMPVTMNLKMTTTAYDATTGEGTYDSEWTGMASQSFPGLDFAYPCGSGTLTTEGQMTVLSTWEPSKKAHHVSITLQGITGTFDAKEGC